MCLLFETIQVRNGVAERISYHNARLNRSREKLLGCADFIDLQRVISVPDECADGVFKCKVTYAESIDNVEFTPYTPRKIHTLQLVVCDEVDYSHKYADRTALDALKARSSADEILIVKNGFITDTSFSNIVFFDGKAWITPAEPLLRGTMRQFLLEQNTIREKPIKPSDIRHFTSAKLINAMLPFSQSEEIQIDNSLRL